MRVSAHRARLSRLVMTDFRSYARAELHLDGRPVVLTGENGAPSIATLRAEALAAQPDLTYAQVVLGFVQENGASRWLNHEEISAAAIAQMEMPLPRRIAGTLEPWDARPH